MGDDYVPSGGGSKRSSKSSSRGGVSVSQADAMSMAYDIVDVLMVLNYEKEFCPLFSLQPVNAMHFARKQPHANQFFYFGALMSWLLGLTGQNMDPPGEYDDPNQVSSDLLVLGKQAGLSMNFPPLKLCAGFGWEVCQTLLGLLHKVLESQRFSWGVPVHKAEAAVVEDVMSGESDDEGLYVGGGGRAAGVGGNGRDSDIRDEIGSDGALDSDDEDLELVMAGSGGRKKEASGKDNGGMSAKERKQWQMEVEAMLPHLKVAVSSDSKDWRTHLSQISQHHTAIGKAMEASQTHLDKMSVEIAATLDKIMSREQYVNQQLDTHVSQHRELKLKYQKIKSQYQETNARVGSLTSELAQVTDQLEEVKQSMEDRGSSMTDASPLKKIKKALTHVKTEIKKMDLRIGILRHLNVAALASEPVPGAHRRALDVNAIAAGGSDSDDFTSSDDDDDMFDNY